MTHLPDHRRNVVTSGYVTDAVGCQHETDVLGTK